MVLTRWRRAAVALVAVAATAACTVEATPIPTAPTTASGAADFQPGSDSLNDPYAVKAGNGGYDVTSYDLTVRYDPTTDVLNGVAVITAVATSNLSRFNLDLRGLAVDQASVDGAAAKAEPSGAELRITPSAGLPTGKTFVTSVTYHGVPQSRDGEGFVVTADGAFVMGEPDAASRWFPVNDHPRDKATYTIKITAPEKLAAISNGVLASRTTAAGQTTWTWRVNQPMAPYLATMVIGDYRVKESTHNGLPVLTAVHHSLPTSIDAVMARSPEVVDFLASQFGPYPFDAIGGVVIGDRNVRFALENQTRPLYGPGFFDERRPDAVWVVVHELAHQWYGDSVSVHDWKDLWLNEGFATFAEWLWTEKKGGGTARQTFDALYAQESDSIWSIPPGDPPKEELFNGSVYTRGGLTLQALRMTVGDQKFFSILKTWASEQAGKSATTPEFIALAERISGQQLDEFFQHWLYDTKRPPRP